MKKRDKRYTTDQNLSRYRTEQEVDRDRILYCPHLARLAEVTQVRTLDGGVLVHNRLTHSLKVGQLARSIASKLKTAQPALAKKIGVDLFAAEAAGLAHDMGHPPFGHIVEEELDALVRSHGDDDGYEGNAQTFRILTTLTVGDTGRTGSDDVNPALNLTAATLNAVLKYPWFHGDNPHKQHKWGAYKSERTVFEFARDAIGLPPLVRSAEAEAMDWADDITYAIHDLADFYCAGLIPLHVLVAGAERWNRQGAPNSDSDVYQQELHRFFEGTFRRCPYLDPEPHKRALVDALRFCNLQAPYEGSLNQSRELWSYSSILIGKYIDDIELIDPAASPDGRCVRISEWAVRQTTMLKQLTWHYVIEHSDLATIQYGQRKMIRELFDVFFDAVTKNKLKLFPIGFEELIRSTPNVSPARWTADYISGLTEREVLRLHHRLINPH